MKAYAILKGHRAVIDVPNGTEEQLDFFYEKIGCRCIDIVRRTIGGKWFDIVCDDEGALVENNIPSAADKNGDLMLYGGIIIFNHEGCELTALTDEDVEWISEFVNFAMITNPATGDFEIIDYLECEYN